ncbi:MAG: DUF4870 domain-containing protein [Actinomycetota bacterium]|nr:DUF4870 domain-containing protein [Rubrobacter sp.]MDQ3506626.1 DUF4870 domain-containing protein [Actinomycetota bacterium]
MDTESVRSYGAVMSGRDERMWSGLAHLSVFLNLFTGFLGPVAAFVIWLVYRDRSETIAFHALQSTWYQIPWLVILWVGWTLTWLLTAVLIGFLMMPVMLVITAIPFIHSAYGAYRISEGDDFRYPLVADVISRRTE